MNKVGIPMDLIGVSIKQIRISKGLTQSYVSEHCQISQSNYAKFEKGSIDIRASTFISILDSMDIPYHEFIYIHNKYKLSKKDDILYNFFNVPFNSIDELNSLQMECRSYLLSYNSPIIKEVYTLSKALLLIYKNNDFNKARQIAKPIWDRLCKSNDLYLYDLYFFNAILYIFSIEEALNLKDFLIRGYEKYKNLNNTIHIFLNTHINFSLFFIEHKRYADALSYLDIGEKICKKQRLYFQLAVIYIRKGICLFNITRNGEDEIEKGINLMKMFEENEALKILIEEIKIYTGLEYTLEKGNAVVVQ